MLSAGLYRGISRWGCGLFGTPMRSIEPWIGWESSLLRLGTGWWPSEDSWGGQRALARSIFRWPRTCFIRRGLPLIFFAVAFSQSASRTSLAYTKSFEPEQVSLIKLLPRKTLYQSQPYQYAPYNLIFHTNFLTNHRSHAVAT